MAAPPATVKAPVVLDDESTVEVSLTFALDVVLDVIVTSPPDIRISALSIVTFASALTVILPSSAEKILIAESLKIKDLSVAIWVLSLNVVFAKEVFLNRKGQEITVVRFTVNEDGSVSNFNTLSYGIVGRVRVSSSQSAGQWVPGGL